jgi:FdhD protein
MPRPSVNVALITKVKSANQLEVDDLIAVEEPLEIRLGSGELENRIETKIAVTMRTPGNDFELAVGFLFTEGIIENEKQILSVKYCNEQGKQEQLENIVRIELVPEVLLDIEILKRNFYTTSSCGVCGKASIEAIHTVSKRVSDNSILVVKSSIILSLPGKLREQQNVFEHTGGLHACALFNTNGELILIREDVGRHNALDKLIGSSLGCIKIEGSIKIDILNCILLLSGRASFELIQKAAMAGIKIVCAIGAPSSLAIETAKSFGITLIGFLRDDHYNIYSFKDRIQF